MFSLDNTMRYKQYNKPVNMRSGDVFVFVNAARNSRNRMKILHCEDGGIVLYALRTEIGRMHMTFSAEPDEIASCFGHASFISAARSAMERPYVRRMKTLSKSL